MILLWKICIFVPIIAALEFELALPIHKTLVLCSYLLL